MKMNKKVRVIVDPIYNGLSKPSKMAFDFLHDKVCISPLDVVNNLDTFKLSNKETSKKYYVACHWEGGGVAANGSFCTTAELDGLIYESHSKTNPDEAYNIRILNISSGKEVIVDNIVTTITYNLV